MPSGSSPSSSDRSLNNHRFNDSISKALSTLKHCVLFRSKAKIVSGLGKDAVERLKKDSKLTATFGAATACSALQRSVAEIQEMLKQEDAQGWLKEAESDNVTSDLKIMPFLVQLVEKMQDVIMHETTINVKDCLEARAAELKTTLELSLEQLKFASQGMFLGGSKDWKASLAKEASLADVLQTAVATIGKVKSAEFQPTIKSCDKARDILHRRHG